MVHYLSDLKAHHVPRSIFLKKKASEQLTHIFTNFFVQINASSHYQRAYYQTLCLLLVTPYPFHTYIAIQSLSVASQISLQSENSDFSLFSALLPAH